MTYCALVGPTGSLRPVSLGSSGKLHRRVWLVADITVEVARATLGSPKAK
jgi:hypothetical protein